jgi:angiopoietin-like 4
MRCAPTAGAVLVLCAATAGLLSAQARPASPEPPRFASWEEMNVLAHGLLQLGRGLHEHVERTRGQLSALERRLAACGAACQGSEATAATPKDPENPIASGETAPETLRSLQVGSADGCVCVCVFGGSASDVCVCVCVCVCVWWLCE